MKAIKYTAVAIITLLAGGCTSVEQKSTADKNSVKQDVTIFYQSNRFGSYEPCGCHTTPYGGVDRETNLIAETKKNGKAIYLDAGNMLMTKEPKTAIEVYQSRAEVISEMLGEMGLDIFSPGENDLRLGLTFLQDLSKKTKFSFISSNLKDTEGKLAFKPYQVVTVGSARLGILAISPTKTGRDFQATDWKAAMNEYLPKAKQESDIVVVLSQLSSKETDELAREFSEVALIVGADEKLSLENPNWVNNGKTLIVDPGINGFSTGRLVWHLNLPYQGSFSKAEVDQATSQIAFYEEKLKANPSSTVIQQEVSFLKKYSQKEIAGGSEYENEIMKLTEEKYGQPNAVTQLMKQSKEKLKQYLVARSKKRRK